MAKSSFHPPRPSAGPLHDAWNRPVSELVLLKTPSLSAAQKERHRLYSLLVCALISHYWNGNKRGEGRYPWREKQLRDDGKGYRGGDYLGHNIACIAVDGRGEVIDFDFNHNDILNSSVEHAESRLVRRVFSLTQIYDDWRTSDPEDSIEAQSYSNLLNEVTVYTSLESCSQCSGIMALGSVKEVIYLHRDPGQSSIGNILRNLGPVGARYLPPLPIPADLFGLPCFQQLEDGYAQFDQEVANKPFFIGADGKPDKSPSITSFLCTDLAFEAFDAGRKELEEKTEMEHPDYKPLCDNSNKEVPKALSNQQALRHVKQFLRYAVTSGRRGTPHKL